MDQCTAEVRAKARELGFTKVGIAKAEALTVEGERLQEWLSRGYHATMQWMARSAAKRADPRTVLPGARSVVAVALNYYAPGCHADLKGTGKISRYAWGDDYHDVMSGKLAELASWLEAARPGCATKPYVDTGPVMDKAWAQRAGIGWEGKHTNVITREVGSWVFLGEILTTAELDPDQPAVDRCGTCTLCIEACPTGAIVEPYVVDSNLCLSYLTIEHRGPISGEVTEHFDGWIYGCDVCQDVCPWNARFSTPSQEQAFSPRQQNEVPVLEEWKTMNQEEFRARFKGSPMKRTKRDGLLRNIGIVLDHGDPRPLQDASHS